MRRRMYSKTVKLTKRAAGFYTDAQLQLMRELFATYINRGGVLQWETFVTIPMNCDEGDLSCEKGSWTKYIRTKLAHEWDAIKCK